MPIGALDALQAYGRALGAAKGSAPAANPGDSPDFGNMVQGAVANTAGALRTAEAASARQVAGTGDLVDVVTAIGAAEAALDTMVAVRDRVVSAYQDIMRLQI